MARVFYLVPMHIGTDNAALIWYQTLQRLWSTVLFGDFAYMVAASADEFGMEPGPSSNENIQGRRFIIGME